MWRASSVVRLLIFLSLLILARNAQAHSWYDIDCCDTRDCRPAEAGEVTVVPDGFDVRVGTQFRHFARTEFRQSQDARFHICVTPATIRCLYVPGGGV
jgi:hypothetical protein